MTYKRPTVKQGFYSGNPQTSNLCTGGSARRASGSATLRRSQTRLFLVDSSESGFRRAIQVIERILAALVPRLTVSIAAILGRFAGSRVAISEVGNQQAVSLDAAKGTPCGMNLPSGKGTKALESRLTLVKGESLAIRPDEPGSPDPSGHGDGVFLDLRHNIQ